MNLNEIWSKIVDETDQAAAIADIMDVFSIVSGSKDSNLPLESIPNGIRFIFNTVDAHRKMLSYISDQLSDYIKQEKAERFDKMKEKLSDIVNDRLHTVSVCLSKIKAAASSTYAYLDCAADKSSVSNDILYMLDIISEIVDVADDKLLNTADELLQ